jgi:inosine-uridine nucleoside N-ribohydrolase
MKKILLLLLPLGIYFAFSSYTRKQAPIAIIFDTDIAPDYDDVGAMAMLHAFADAGEVKILATISCNAFETTAPTLSLLNQYFGRQEVPIGVTKNPLPNKDCSQFWAQAILKKYPHALASNSEATDAILLYRKILAAQPDHSVTIISVGFFTNLAGLLQSGPDDLSHLTGMELVKKKVTKLVSMAGSLGQDGKSGYEFNVMVDPPASKKVFEDWPTPIIISGFEIGDKILTGIRLINNEAIQNSPVKDAFQVALKADKNTNGRNSWDETAVLVAVRGIAPFFNSRKINLEIKPDGKDTLVPGEKFTWLQFRQSPKAIGVVIEDLMMHQPEKK